MILDIVFGVFGRKKEKCHVYFIRNGFGHIKIGIANDVGKRVKQLQTGNPMKLEVYHVLETKNRETALKIEKELHRKFSKEHLSGEWFEENKVLKWLNHRVIKVCGCRFNGRGWL